RGGKAAKSGAVFVPGVAWRLGEHSAHGKEQLSRLARDLVDAVDCERGGGSQQRTEKQLPGEGRAAQSPQPTPPRRARRPSQPSTRGPARRPARTPPLRSECALTCRA